MRHDMIRLWTELSDRDKLLIQHHVIFLFLHHANRLFTWLNFVFLVLRDADSFYRKADGGLSPGISSSF